jgi:hypothetical protein
MTDLQRVPLEEKAPGRREAGFEGRAWLRRVTVLTAEGEPIEVRTGDEDESGLLVLSGTHDLEANAGSWVSRGTRTTPFEGRPVALFMPPKTRFRSSGGAGDLLLVSARRPELAAPPVEPEAKPLLPLAGSNQAYDSKSGSWKPIESFPDSAEAILPRRIERADVGGVAVERVFPPDYKTLGLCLAEAVVPDGAALTAPGWIGANQGVDYPEEWAVYYRAEGQLRASDETLAGDGVLAGHGAVELRAAGGRVYLALLCAGPKPAA